MGNTQSGMGVPRSGLKSLKRRVGKQEKKLTSSLKSTPTKPINNQETMGVKWADEKVGSNNLSSSDGLKSNSSGSDNNDTLADLDTNNNKEGKTAKLTSITQMLADIPIFPGRRSRRGSEDDGPVRICTLPRGPPSVPPEEVWDPSSEDALLESCHSPLSSSPSPPRRPRALTISNGQAAKARLYFKRLMAETSKKEKLNSVPTVIRLSEALVMSVLDKKDVNTIKVYVAGSMTQWRCVEMLRAQGERDFLIIVNCLIGKNFFRFNVNNVWLHDPAQEYVGRRIKNDTKKWNVVNVSRADHDVFDALAFDSFLIKTSDADNQENNDTGIWTQDVPLSSLSRKGPPILPPQLLQDVLSRPVGAKDPVLLKEPSHVTLNHIYAQSIKDNVMVVRSTIRYRRKCVTLVFYKSLDQQ